MNKAFISRVLLVAALIACGLQAETLPIQASVSGHAVRSDGSTPPGPCRATLRKEIDRRGAPDLDQETPPDGKTNFSVTLDQHANFQFAGLSPGKHMLVVECPTASAVRELSVQANKQARLDPVLLEDFTLQIAITPKLDPDGKPWQLSVDATMPRLRRITSNATTSTDGRWTHRGLAAGNYRVSVNSSDGKPWINRFFNLSATSAPLSLHLPFMRVSGQVHLSAQPVHGRLVFFNEAGGEPMTLTSDENGFFQGLLPVTPGAQKTSWTIEARGTEPPVSRRLSGITAQSLGETNAWLDLALPAFAVHGTVASEKGDLQSGVQVSFENISTGARASTASDEAGAFELHDLSPGKYIAVAESMDGASERTPFQVADGIESEVKLILTPSERIPFNVVSRQGPVAGATVQVWIQPGQPWDFTRTGQDGHFELKLPPGTTEIGMTVGAPGYAIKLTRVKISTNSDSSSDANTIDLDESSGTLMLDLKPQDHTLDNSTTAYLVHDKAVEAVGTLSSLSTDQAYASNNGSTVVKAIEPGNYALCLLSDPAQLTTLWFGGLPTDRCRKGSVERGETLTLSAP